MLLIKETPFSVPSQKHQGFFDYDHEIDVASAKAKRNYYQKPIKYNRWFI